MNIKDAKEQIKNSITAYFTTNEIGKSIIPLQKQRPLFLIGPPGIGKTAIIEQLASELGICLLSYSMTHHTRQSALGLPLIKHVEYQGKEFDVSEYTMSEIISSVYRMMEDTGIKKGILFLDEINCVSETLTPIMLQFLQYKTFGCYSIPEDWIVVTAGNPPEYNRSVREFDIATWDRVKRIDIDPDITTWKEYAYQTGVHSSIITYLEVKSDNFYKVETTVDGKRFVTARGWDDLSQMINLYEINNIPVDIKLISQYIQHTEIARDFSGYYSLYTKYRSDYQINNILSGNPDVAIKMRITNARFDERFSLIGLMLESVMIQARVTMNEDAVMTEVMGELKNFKKLLDSPFVDSVAVLEKICNNKLEELKNSINSNSLSNEQQIHKNKVIDILKNDIYLIKKNSENNAFAVVKQDFDSRVSELNKSVEKTKMYITNMFKFVDEVFSNGQEVAIIVTELAANPVTVRFLANYNVDEYFKHNKELLFSDRKIDLLNKIEKMNFDD